jgi:cephalosporin hydroxylase
MSDSTAGAAAAERPTNFKRLFVIVAIGLGSINVVQLAIGALADRALADAQRAAEAQHIADGQRIAEAQRIVEAQRAALSPQATADRFHDLFYKNRNTVGRNQWMGIRTQQNPNDVWIAQEILFEVKPDFVVECGAFMGGSAVLWATVLREINPAGRVIAIDVEDRLGEAKKLPIFKERVDFLLGSSTAPEVVGEVKRRVAGRSVVVILDSDHAKHHVLQELKAYADLVRPGSYIIVQDSDINGHPVVLDPTGVGGIYAGQAGPWEAIQEFVASDKRFKSDLDRERLMLTFNTNGFLRRVE